MRCIRERCPEEISEVAALLKGGQRASQRWRGAISQRASGVQRVWHAAGTSSSYGGMVCATTSLLSRGPLGVRRWTGRPSCHSLVREPRTFSGPDRLGRARTGHELHTHQVARAVNPVQSRRDACCASVLMKLTAAVRRCRKEPPEAPGDGRRCCLRPTGGKPSTSQCTPELVLTVGPSGTAWGSRNGFRRSRYYGFELSCIIPTYT